MSNKNFNSSVLERNRQSRAIYSNYRINMLGIEQGIPANPISIKGGSADITQALVQGPVVFTPAELTAILNNNSGSTAPSGPSGPLTFTSASPPAFPYTIPALYTLLSFILIGGGGGGSPDSGGGGGGGGGYLSASFPVNGGAQITQFSKGIGGSPNLNGTATSLNYENGVKNISAEGGGSGSSITGGSVGIISGVDIGNITVAVVNSAQGIPGSDGSSTDIFDENYEVIGVTYNFGIGGNNGSNTGVYGNGGRGGGNGGGGVEAGSNGYWEFTLSY
jgi:hypothetical protein